MQLRDPHHQRRERFGSELLEQLGQILFGGVDRGFVERLQEL